MIVFTPTGNDVAGYRRNPLREDRIRRHGQTVDLPLFDRQSDAVPLSEILPKAIPLATDTKRISRTVQTHNPFRLALDQQKVYDLLSQEENMTNKEMAARLGWDASTVSARNYELRQLGLVVRAEKKRACHITGNIVTAWKLK